MTSEEARDWLCEHLRPVLDDELAAGATVGGFVSGMKGWLAVSGNPFPVRSYPAPVEFWDDYPKKGNPHGMGGGYSCPEHQQLVYLVDGGVVLVQDVESGS